MACGQTKATNPMTAGIATSIKDIIFPPERFFGSMWLQPASFAGSKPDHEQETCNKRQNSGAWDTAPHARSCDIHSDWFHCKAHGEQTNRTQLRHGERLSFAPRHTSLGRRCL